VLTQTNEVCAIEASWEDYLKPVYNVGGNIVAAVVNNIPQLIHNLVTQVLFAGAAGAGIQYLLGQGDKKDDDDDDDVTESTNNDQGADNDHTKTNQDKGLEKDTSTLDGTDNDTTSNNSALCYQSEPRSFEKFFQHRCEQKIVGHDIKIPGNLSSATKQKTDTKKPQNNTLTKVISNIKTQSDTDKQPRNDGKLPDGITPWNFMDFVADQNPDEQTYDDNSETVKELSSGKCGECCEIECHLI